MSGFDCEGLKVITSAQDFTSGGWSWAHPDDLGGSDTGSDAGSVVESLVDLPLPEKNAAAWRVCWMLPVRVTGAVCPWRPHGS